MNKKSTGRLMPLLTGLVSRMEDNADFFVSLTAEFKSGTKPFTAVIENAKTIRR